MRTFEITVQRKDGAAWPLVAVQHLGGGLPIRDEATLRLDPAALTPDLLSPRVYGERLGRSLFTGSVLEAFHQAVTRSGERLHVLLHVEAPELQEVRWERLCAPLSSGWDFLGLNQATPFSLYLPSATDRRFPPFGRADLRALIVAACPPGLDGSQQPAFDAAAAATAARISLGPIPGDILAVGMAGAVGLPTLDELCDWIGRRRYPILHVICHGGRGKVDVDGVTVEDNWLYLSDANGKAKAVGGQTLIERLSRLEGPTGLPQFIFLAACETSTPGGRQAVGGLAQRLVREPQLGVPAVLAMTERVSVETATRLTTAFYERLREHGEPDLALSQACAGLAGRDDVNVPALYTRLGGRPLFSDADRPLTVGEIAAGLDRMATELAARAPVLVPEFAAIRTKLTPTLSVEFDLLSPAGQADRNAALERVGAIAVEALDTNFTAVAFGRPLAPARTTCPFPGLYPFRIAQKEFFHGRERLVEDLFTRLQEDNFLAVLGPSGSGKSSVVLAGVLPRLLGRGRAKRFEYLTPGEDPLEFLDMATGRTPPPDLLVVDQFEELFTLCPQPAERKRFADRLVELSDTMVVIVTMRADFWGECAALGELQKLMQRRQELVGPMTTTELRSAVQQQAAAAGLEFEAGLDGVMIDEVAGEPGAMPLLQHALQELWKRRRGRWLTAKKAGGERAEHESPEWVRRSIAETAEEVYQALPTDSKQRVRDIFTRLTRLEDTADGEARRDTRQRVKLAELTPAGGSTEETKRLVASLANEGARLLVTGVHKGETTVEVAHEALIRHWPRLRRWLEDDRASLQLLASVRAAAGEWEAAPTEDSLLTHRGARLVEAEKLLTHPRLRLNDLEGKYLTACRAAEARVAAAQRQTRRRFLAVAVGGVAAAATAGGGVFALTRPPPVTTVQLIDATTNDLIRRPFTLRVQTLRQADGMTVFGWGGEARQTHVMPGEMRVLGVEVAGYTFADRVETRDSTLRVFVSRQPHWRNSILPAYPAYECDGLPSDKKYPTDLVRMEDVRLTFTNSTPHHADLFLFHRPPYTGPRPPDPDPEPWGLTSPPCPPRGSQTLGVFGKSPGGFIAFAAVQGEIVTRGRFFHLYRTTRPHLKLVQDAGGGYTVEEVAE